MRLDIDCVRNVLLDLEKLPLGCHTPYSFPKSISKNGVDNVEYTLAKLKEAGYINADIQFCQNGEYEFYGVYDMTFSGHQFLEKIKDDNVWGKTKSVASSIGSKAFDVITQVASSVITELINSRLNA